MLFLGEQKWRGRFNFPQNYKPKNKIKPVVHKLSKGLVLILSFPVQTHLSAVYKYKMDPILQIGEIFPYPSP